MAGIPAASLAAKEAQGLPDDPELYCEVCDTWANSRDHMAAHKAGKKHQKKLNAARMGHPQQRQAMSHVQPAPGPPGSGFQQPWQAQPAPDARNAEFCQVCEVSVPRGSMEVHLSGRLHAQKVKSHERGGAAPSGAPAPAWASANIDSVVREYLERNPYAHPYVTHRA